MHYPIDFSPVCSRTLFRERSAVDKSGFFLPSISHRSEKRLISSSSSSSNSISFLDSMGNRRRRRRRRRKKNPGLPLARNAVISFAGGRTRFYGRFWSRTNEAAAFRSPPPIFSNSRCKTTKKLPALLLARNAKILFASGRTSMLFHNGRTRQNFRITPGEFFRRFPTRRNFSSAISHGT